MASRYDAPVGTMEERDSSQLWPGDWVDATGFGTYYDATGAWAYHTGADLNLNKPTWDADRDAPVYAVADGTVVYAAINTAWGTNNAIITIRHSDGIWSRYAHIEKLLVKAGDFVTRGQRIAEIGNAGGRYPSHLHFDVARLDLGAKPADWPGADKARLLRDYVDPLQWIKNHHKETTPKWASSGQSKR